MKCSSEMMTAEFSDPGFMSGVNGVPHFSGVCTGDYDVT